ncbi:aquaporin AQPcic-like isoform X1 [Lucilia cuprina]|uniref:aquaporin AQPcic-like isoform X1 n=2 Tax=Lucilia cuprina TaxID=7375 RepID=UPI001F051EE6|nr:aquaporin AQPcic-like isoform X1 [Lucilia cuprina]
MVEAKESSYSNFWEKYKMKTATLDKICCFLAELIGTGLLVFLGCMGCVKTDVFANNHLQMCLNFGLVILVIIQCFGCVSGSHLNPAVTIAAFIYEMVSAPMAIVYMCGQMLGGFIGYGLLKVVLPESTIKMPEAAHNLCVTVPHPDITPMQGFAIEFIISAILILVCCGVWDPRNAKFHDSVPIRFGLAIACLAITAGPFTGASMNPARSFAPALWNYDFEHHWVYWLGPMLGGAVAAYGYKVVFRREVNEEAVHHKLRAMEDVPLS